MIFDFDGVAEYDGNLAVDLEKHIAILVPYWASLRLSTVAAKFHIVKDHLVTKLLTWGAIGSFNEEFAEADHTKGNAEKRQWGSLRDTQKKEESISKRHAVLDNKDVIQIREDISPKRKRKRLRLDDRARIIEQRREVFESLDYELNTIRTGGVIMADAEEKHQFLAFPFIDDYWNFSTDVTQE